jgi:hypothetical protein
MILRSSIPAAGARGGPPVKTAALSALGPLQLGEHTEAILRTILQYDPPALPPRAPAQWVERRPANPR